MTCCKTTVALLACLAIGNVSSAQTWNTYRHDNRRSGVTEQSLSFPLEKQWERKSKHPPQAAWTGPAKWDAWSGNRGLQSMRNFDPCFFVTSDGDRVYFGSSVDDAAHCLDAATGKETWVRFTAAPVRFPPTIDQGRAYFGSDDGNVYCCDAVTGDTLWNVRAAVNDRRITSNGKLISLFPVRTGVMVQNGRAVFASSLVPWETSLLWSVDAQSGSTSEPDTFRKEVSDVTLQGALLASDERIYAPQGRAAPLAFSLTSGKPLGAIGEAGGVFCILTEDEMLLAGPQNQKSGGDEMRIADGTSRQRLASFSGSDRILVSGEQAWVPSAGKLKSLNRKRYVTAQLALTTAERKIKELEKKKQSVPDALRKERDEAIQSRQAAWQWETPCEDVRELIKCGDSIIVGLDQEVKAFSASDGKLRWRAPVEGVAYGLAVARGRLFVSTGRGHLYAFGEAK